MKFELNTFIEKYYLHGQNQLKVWSFLTFEYLDFVKLFSLKETISFLLQCHEGMM